MMRRYSCNKYKNYSIRSHYFVNGLFQTDDPSVQQLIENADGYGVFIHPVESPRDRANESSRRSRSSSRRASRER